MRTKGIGPQGLGLKGNNGYSIGSPAKQKERSNNPKRKEPLQNRGPQNSTSKEKQRQGAIQKAKAMGHGSPAKKKDACYRKAKAKYDVFPSAYASGYIAKCRKKKGNIG